MVQQKHEVPINFEKQNDAYMICFAYKEDDDCENIRCNYNVGINLAKYQQVPIKTVGMSFVFITALCALARLYLETERKTDNL